MTSLGQRGGVSFRAVAIAVGDYHRRARFSQHIDDSRPDAFGATGYHGDAAGQCEEIVGCGIRIEPVILRAAILDSPNYHTNDTN